METTSSIVHIATAAMVRANWTMAVSLITISPVKNTYNTTTYSNQTATLRVNYADLPLYKLSAVFFGIYPFILLIVGTSGNFMALLVLNRKSYRGSSSFYLRVLAVFDTLIIWHHLTLIMVPQVYHNDIVSGPSFCKFNFFSKILITFLFSDLMYQ